MKLGFVSAILSDLSLEQVLSVAADQGFDCVELMCWPAGAAERRYAGVTHIDVANMDEAAAAQINQMVHQSGVSISSLGYYPNPLTPDPAEALAVNEHLRRVIDASAMLGVNLVTTFIGRDWRKTVAQNWPRFIEVWKPLIAYAESRNVRVGIENCPMLFSEDEWPGGKNLATCPAVWQRMFEAIPSDCFGLNYDPSHMVWQWMDYLAPLREFADRIFHIHAKDTRIDRQKLDRVGIMAAPSEYHVAKLPGLGEIDWDEFISILAETGYTGPVCVEVEDRAYEGSLETRLAALHQSSRFLRNLLRR